MRSYLIKLLSADGRLAGRLVFQAVDDQEAMRIVERQRRGRHCDLFCGPRLVTRWGAQRSGSRRDPGAQGAGAAAP